MAQTSHTARFPFHDSNHVRLNWHVDHRESDKSHAQVQYLLTMVKMGASAIATEKDVRRFLEERELGRMFNNGPVEGDWGKVSPIEQFVFDFGVWFRKSTVTES